MWSVQRIRPKDDYAPKVDKLLQALPTSLAQARHPCVTRGTHLPLLPSGPDGVQQALVAQDPTINTTCAGQAPTETGRILGIQFCFSGLQIQGTATSPPSIAKALIIQKLAERVGFEPTVLQNSTHDFQSCQFNQLLHLSVL